MLVQQYVFKTWRTPNEKSTSSNNHFWGSAMSRKKEFVTTWEVIISNFPVNLNSQKDIYIPDQKNLQKNYVYNQNIHILEKDTYCSRVSLKIL